MNWRFWRKRGGYAFGARMLLIDSTASEAAAAFAERLGARSRFAVRTRVLGHAAVELSCGSCDFATIEEAARTAAEMQEERIEGLFELTWSAVRPETDWAGTKIHLGGAAFALGGNVHWFNVEDWLGRHAEEAMFGGQE